MPPKSLNNNNNDSTTDDKNKYVKSLINDFREIQNGNQKTAKIDLTKVNIKQAAKLIQQNVNNKKLALKFDTGSLYMLNDNTMNKLMKGLIDKTMYVQEVAAVHHSDAELVSYIIQAKTITLNVIEAKGDQVPDKRLTKKTRPGGGFFKFSNKTHFDFSRYGIFKDVNKENYNDNCLYFALKAAGLPEEKLQQLKMFVMNRIVPKCKLGEVCKLLQICIKLTSIGRVEHFGDKSHPCFHIGLVDEHYFIIEKTNVTSFSILNYEDIKHLPNCNMFYRKIEENKYKTSNDKFIDSFKLIKLSLDNKETLLEPIY